MALYKSLSVYFPSRPGTETEAEAEVEAQETAGVGLKVPLSLIKTPAELR